MSVVLIAERSIPRAELVRRTAYCLFERAAEILRVLVAQCIGYLADALLIKDKHIFGGVHNLSLHVFLRRLSGLFFYQVAEIVW